uniref:AtC3H23-like CCCH zinc finger domain-containing protein n=2 Tax=Physcomitrium patens TaxID=3218 RepID=A0A7I4BLV8_PHYPA
MGDYMPMSQDVQAQHAARRWTSFLPAAMHDAEAPRDDALCGVYQRSHSFWGSGLGLHAFNNFFWSPPRSSMSKGEFSGFPMANEESRIEAGSGEGSFYEEAGREQVRRCMRGRSHDWTEGAFAHPGEKARHCNPRWYEDSGTTCREFQKRELSERRCVRVWVHLSIEYWVHLAGYLDAAVQGWAELASSSVVFGAYVGAAAVDAYGSTGGTGSDDKRSEHKA